tara:strand:+ start:376 stop:609 length:234 start_codon:yes stop_codon:yes gene_type:complete
MTKSIKAPTLQVKDLDEVREIQPFPIKELKKVIEYSYGDELKHFLEEGYDKMDLKDRKEHIFYSIDKVSKWIDSMEF